MATPPNPSSAVPPKRFDIELPLEFRPQGSDRWWQAKTDNISASGALFRTRNPVPPLTPVEVRLQLPASLTGKGTVRLLCSGHVVRSVEPQPPFDEMQIAATFHSYRLTDGEPTQLEPGQVKEAQREIADLVHRLNTLLFIMAANTEFVLEEPTNACRVQNLALQAHQAAEEAANVVSSLAYRLAFS